ncbi:hypothetical protein BHE74_00024508 [Ensete ventricosum]|nr:hypothetical protein BHE74_00024508 [Ensete ventricosum]
MALDLFLLAGMVFDDNAAAADRGRVVSVSMFVAVLCLCVVVGHLLEENRWTNESITAIVIITWDDAASTYPHGSVDAHKRRASRLAQGSPERRRAMPIHASSSVCRTSDDRIRSTFGVDDRKDHVGDLVVRARFSIPICTAVPGDTYWSARLLVRGPPATERYRQNRPPPKSTVGGRLREKKGRRRRGKEEEEEKKNTSHRPRSHAVVARGSPVSRPRSHAVAARGSPAIRRCPRAVVTRW